MQASAASARRAGERRPCAPLSDISMASLGATPMASRAGCQAARTDTDTVTPKLRSTSQGLSASDSGCTRTKRVEMVWLTVCRR